MSDGNPISINLNTESAETTLPLIVDGTVVKMRLAGLEQVDKEDKTSLKWRFDLLEPAPTEDGGEVSPGFPIFVNIPCYASETAKDKEWFIKKISKFIDGLLGTGDPNNKDGKETRPSFNADLVPSLIGQETFGTVSIERSNTSDYVGNGIKKLTHPSEID